MDIFSSGAWPAGVQALDSVKFLDKSYVNKTKVNLVNHIFLLFFSLFYKFHSYVHKDISHSPPQGSAFPSQKSWSEST